MTYKLEFNKRKNIKIIEQNGLIALQKTAKEVKKEIDKQTPIDTEKLIGNTKTTKVFKRNNKLVIKIYNNTKYAEYVEYGVGKIYNYHKYGEVFYKGVGAGMFVKSFMKWKNKYGDFISKQIKGLNKK